MKYRNIKEALFLLRKNRFVCEISICGKTEMCHVKNTGRLGELLLPGATVYVEETDKNDRKTRYDLISVLKDGKIVNVDSFSPNVAVGEYLRKIYPDCKITPEKKYKNSRFDFYVEGEKEKIFIEVKGVTLFCDGFALFPDAPTERGIKHLCELCDCKNNGYTAKVFFVIAADSEGKLVFTPNKSLDTQFSEALLFAKENGVEVLAFDCNVKCDSIEIKSEINTLI